MLQTERRAAVVYLSQPNAANLGSFQGAVTATRGRAAGRGGAHLAGHQERFDPGGNRGHRQDARRGQRHDRVARAGHGEEAAPLGALEAYTNIIAGQAVVLQAEANSILDSAPALQGLGLISAVNTQEDVSEQDAVLASALVSGSLTAEDRVAFSNAVGRLQSDTLSYQQLLTPAELKIYNDTLNALAPTAIQNDLTTIQQAVPAGIPLTEMQQQRPEPRHLAAADQHLAEGREQGGHERRDARCSRPTRSPPSTPSGG